MGQKERMEGRREGGGEAGAENEQEDGIRRGDVEEGEAEQVGLESSSSLLLPFLLPALP